MSKREQIFEALYAQVTRAPAVFTFTANVTEGSATLGAVSDPTGLRLGMPIFGPGIPAGAIIATISPEVTIATKLWLPDPAAPDATIRKPVTTPAVATATATAAALRQGFRATGRRVPFINQAKVFPGLFVRSTDDMYPARPARGMPARVTMDAEIWIYADAGTDESGVPGERLDPLVEAIEATLKPPPGLEAVTLGGLVHHCWIEGMVERDPGDLTGKAIAIIDVRMLVPALV